MSFWKDLFGARPIKKPAPVKLWCARDIPEIISQLQRSGGDGSFAVLIFVAPDSTDGEAVNLQYSIENGTVGFDWVLIGPRNVADKAKVFEIASRMGYHLEEHEMNDVRYLRVTGSGISELGVRIIQGVYKIDPNSQILDLLTEGFICESPAQDGKSR